MTAQNKRQTGPFHRIALWQTAFLGDAVLTLPLAQALHQAWPEADMHFYVRKGLGPLFSAQPQFAAVHEVDKRGGDSGAAGAWRIGRRLAAQDFDLLVSAHTSFRSAIVSFASRIPVRLGYDAPLYNRLAYTMTCPRRFEERDEIERLLGLAEALGIPAADSWPRIALPPVALEAAGRILSGLRDRPFVGLHPGSVWPTKRWPTAHFSRLADMALASGASVLLFAGPGEEATAAEVIEGMRGKDSPRLVNLAGRLSLPDLAAVIGRLDVYVTGDSGPMHLSWAQGTPTVAVFGPTVRSLGFFPRGGHSRVLELDLPCRPCGLHGPKECPQGHHRCMLGITPEEAWSAVADALHRSDGKSERQADEGRGETP
ncbi:lipopolysaccharide heptosyltransferase II [Desulfovibrio sp. X2]|uniref:lipopolysaccharide heptosyltransferase II n=1 Tax=Desulfovibrio sp. X2 TaxID=941449 RepID=UPI0012692A68|nr:lipopolysaccharide heptosyltransferase II [Desulfovibrio sp. X2]